MLRNQKLHQLPPLHMTHSLEAKKNNNIKNDSFSKQEGKQKTKAVLSSMKPCSLTSLASEDVNYIIIKTEDDCEPPTTEMKRLKLVKVGKPIMEVGKKQKGVQPITGPFECIKNGFCHRIFFSCCEYSTHYRNEHTRGLKVLRCQVCEKPLSLDVNEQHPYACETEVHDGSSSEEIDADLSNSSPGLKAKHKHNGLVEASVELHEGNNKWSLVVDAADANASIWCEQNLASPQHQEQIDYRTTTIIPRFTELRFDGSELKHYNSPSGYAQKIDATVQKKRKLSTDIGSEVNQTSQATEEGITNYIDIGKTSHKSNQETVFTKTNNSNEDSTISNANNGYHQNKQEKCIIVKNNLRNIQKRINNYTCDVCKQSFISKNMLEYHINSHYAVLRQKHNTLSSNNDRKHKKKIWKHR